MFEYDSERNTWLFFFSFGTMHAVLLEADVGARLNFPPWVIPSRWRALKYFFLLGYPALNRRKIEFGEGSSWRTKKVTRGLIKEYSDRQTLYSFAFSWLSFPVCGKGWKWVLLYFTSNINRSLEKPWYLLFTWRAVFQWGGHMLR